MGDAPHLARPGARPVACRHLAGNLVVVVEGRKRRAAKREHVDGARRQQPFEQPLAQLRTRGGVARVALLIRELARVVDEAVQLRVVTASEGSLRRTSLYDCVRIIAARHTVSFSRHSCMLLG